MVTYVTIAVNTFPNIFSITKNKVNGFAIDFILYIINIYVIINKRSNNIKTIERIYFVLNKIGVLKIFLGFIIICILSSIIFMYIEPNINHIRDGIWYCFVASTTIGFGYIYATTTIG